MPISRAAARSWIEGFEAAHAVERSVARPEDAGRTARLALQLSEAALRARAPQAKSRRDAEDARARDVWCGLKARGK
jgi:hypothetical protein